VNDYQSYYSNLLIKKFSYMKKFLCLLFGLAVVVSASANVTFKSANVAHRQLATKLERVPVVKKNNVLPAMPLLKAGPMRAASDVITTQPAGELRTYTRSGEAMVYDSEDGLSLTLQSGDMSIVFADGNKVYLLNPLYGLSTGAWVEGTINEDGTKITVPMGQFIYWASAGYGLILKWGSIVFDEEGYVDFVPDDNVTEMTYTVAGNTITMDNCAGDAYNFDGATGLGAIWDDDLTWQGFTEWNTVFTYSGTEEPGDDPGFDPSSMITTQPEGELVEYVRSGDAIIYSSGYYLDAQSGTAYIVYAPDGETVYLQDPVYGLSQGTWVKGTISGNKITVPLGQFIYYSTSGGYGLILDWGSVDASATYTSDTSVTEVTYTINGNVITLDNSVGGAIADGFSGCTGLGLIWNDDLTWQGFINWNTVYNKLEEAVPAVPSDPEALEWDDRGDDTGMNSLYFKVNLEDVNGVLMHEGNLSYSIYIDNDQLFTFDAATYAADNTTIFADGVDMTEIPYNVRDYDFYPQRCYFYRTNAEGYEPFFTWRIGIQVHNTVDGVKNSSNIVYIEVFEKPVEALIGDVNGDKEIDVADVTALINYVLNGDDTGIILENSNINGDDDIDVADVTELISMVLGV